MSAKGMLCDLISYRGWSERVKEYVIANSQAFGLTMFNESGHNSANDVGHLVG